MLNEIDEDIRETMKKTSYFILIVFLNKIK